MDPLGRLIALVNRLKPSGSTGERVAKSGFWLAGQNVIGRLLQLGMLAILARLIGPGELGLVGIALLALSAVKQFTNIGVNAALIQRVEEDVDSHLNTTWLLEIGRGLIIFAVLFAAAPFVAEWFFGEPRATWLIRIIGLSPVILGLRNPGMVYFQKNLEFEKQFVYKVSGDLAQLLVGVGYALVEPTAWAFVFGFIAADVVKLPVSYLMHDYRPWPSFDLDIAKELVDYGKWLTGSSILYFLYSEGDDAFVGWLLTPTALAFYQYTYRFSNAPATELTQVVNGVMFPAFSKVQEDSAQLRSAFLRTLRMTTFIAFPASVGIAAVAPTFIIAVFGEEWLPAIPVMQILAFYGLLRGVGRTFGPVWKTVGRPDYITKTSAVRVVLLAIAIYPLTNAFGIVGTALAVTGIYIFPMTPLEVYITAREIDLPAKDIYYEFVFPALACAPMSLVIWYLQPRIPLGPFPRLAVLIATGAAVFVATVLLIEWQFSWKVSDKFQNIAQNLAS